ncbi:hypothetical protein DPMN_052399 [Dreissena polymorpha]|uniref:Uncharacterized protein n=1 Tax=Dreissena polymorpha TaxID=45954 RepID=A0A9D4CL75_DREPO|nr:hypothetical protein DPMN_052399 [Dreissena polymorpha]
MMVIMLIMSVVVFQWRYEYADCGDADVNGDEANVGRGDDEAGVSAADVGGGDDKA